jgi:hypothetical protein
MKKGFQNKKLVFYHQKRKETGSVSAKMRDPAPMATTPGFFHMRSQRNTSMINTQQNVQSKSFQNYVKARERVESNAKDFVDRLNNNAL